MSAPGHAVTQDSLRIAEDADVSNWIESLAASECTEDEFIDEILRREQVDANVGWETLAELDQQFRRKRIDHDAFMSLKIRLHQRLLSLNRNARASTAAESAAPARPVEVPFHGELREGDKLLERYRIAGILRSSSAGTLVEAIDELDDNPLGATMRVAIQVMDEAASRNREFLLRLDRLMRLAHPAIASLFDVDEVHGSLLIVQELLDGPSLHELVARAAGHPLPAKVAHAALRDVASALAHAHSQGITHGNISARNIFVTQAGDFRLQGFELQDPLCPAETAGDRRAFARLAYQVLGGPEAVNADPDKRLRRLAPRGFRRTQWRALRDTLNRKEGSRHDVLAAFMQARAPSIWAGILRLLN